MIDRLIDSKWPPRIMLGLTILIWAGSLADSDLFGYAVALGIITWGLYEQKAYERRRTAPERAKRASRELELAMLAHMGAEDYLRRILIGDLKHIEARQRARAYIEQEMGLKL